MLNRLPLGQKMAVCIAPLIIGILIAGGVLISEHWTIFKKSEEMKVSVTAQGALSQLLHQFQKERGMSVLFSKGKATETELKDQRQQTDEKIKVLTDSVNGLETEISDIIFDSVKGFQKVREKVDQKASTNEIVPLFSAAVVSLIEAQVKRARLHPWDGYENRLISQSIFESAKENMGRLRASLSNVLSADAPISMAEFGKLDKFRISIATSLESPALMISTETRKGLESLLKSDEWKEVLKSVDAIREASTTGHYGVDPKAMFQTQTQLIDRTFGLINAEESELETLIHALSSQTQFEFWLWILVVTLGTSSVGAMAWKISKQITLGLLTATQNMNLGATQTTTSSRHLSQSSVSLSSVVTEQASAVQETAASLEEIQAMVAKTAENAQVLRQASEAGTEEVQVGSKAVTDLDTAMAEILKTNGEMVGQIEESSEEVSAIVEVINKIAERTKIIHDIVFQTKLLSFNASVEAARAGEHGKGFSVVAEEVGNLAQMSGNAAQEISGLVDESTRKVQAVVSKSRSRVQGVSANSQKQSEMGKVTASRCREAFDTVQAGMDKIAKLVDEVASAGSEQNQGLKQISIAMHRLDQVTQTNSATAQEVAAIANELNHQADRLHQSIEGLDVLVRGGKAQQYVGHSPESKAEVVLPKAA